ncbi:MAG: YfiR family protein [Planctomycetota bacterium]|nr:YfiR family protein [Planctomycetota bacterium]
MTRGTWSAGLVFALTAVIAAGLESRAHAAFDTRVSSSSDSRDADSVKAAFVYNFAARHVKWPDTGGTDKTAPFVIGVLGSDPIASSLVETCRNRKSGDRPIEVRVLEDVSSAASCQILVVPANRESAMPAIVETCRGRAILIVASSEDAVRKGAHIGFFLEKSKVRFAADPQAARKSGLEVSSELLKLARVVDKSAGGPP